MTPSCSAAVPPLVVTALLTVGVRKLVLLSSKKRRTIHQPFSPPLQRHIPYTPCSPTIGGTHKQPYVPALIAVVVVDVDVDVDVDVFFLGVPVRSKNSSPLSFDGRSYSWWLPFYWSMMWERDNTECGRSRIESNRIESNRIESTYGSGGGLVFWSRQVVCYKNTHKAKDPSIILPFPSHSHSPSFPYCISTTRLFMCVCLSLCLYSSYILYPITIFANSSFFVIFPSFLFFDILFPINLVYHSKTTILIIILSKYILYNKTVTYETQYVCHSNITRMSK